MEAHAPELRRHLTGMLAGEDDAEDVLQEVWVSAYRRPPETGDGNNVRAWLYRVATNAALDRLSRDRRRRTALEGRRPELLPDPTAPPDESLERLGDGARARVRELVAGLPRKQREAVWLRWIEEEEYADIAKKMGSSEGSARANVYQGLKRLRSELFDVWRKEGRE